MQEEEGEGEKEGRIYISCAMDMSPLYLDPPLFSLPELLIYLISKLPLCDTTITIIIEVLQKR
jgi:hypothetical protein